MRLRHAIPALAALALVVAPAAALAQEGAPALATGLEAKEVRAFDLPSDRGESLAVTWPEVPGERAAASGATGTSAPAFEYYVTIAAAGGYASPVEVAKFGAGTNWQRDIAFKFGTGAYFSKDHAIIVDPLQFYSAHQLAEAALGVPEAVQAANASLGAEAIVQARALLAAEHVRTLEELALVPDAVDDVGARVVLDREFTLALGVRAPGATEGRIVASIPGVRPVANWYDWKKSNALFVLLFVGGAVFYFIGRARKNPDLYLRRIGGLDAIDEALGRATEMGKPVLFVHGLETLQKVPTIAAINILGEVSKKVAAYDTRLICANYDPIVLTVSQETVKEGFLRAGRPDAFNQDDVFLAGAEQFSYVAAVDGIMLRQTPAANIYAGYFYAESLLLAETGASTGAIQIAATDAYTQLPFFVTTCDYTLMGEELYAASAYLSRDPPLLGSLRGQDLGKAAVIAAILLGTLEATVRAMGGLSLDFAILKNLVR